jgi:tetratricopeptide (TPR) repeat protein
MNGWRRIWLVVLVAPIVAGAATAERWVRVATPEFTVVTPLPEAQAKAWSADFAQYVAALRGLLHSETRRFTPLTIVLFARERDFTRYRPLQANGKVQDVDGFFLRHESWAVAGLAGPDQSADVRRTIFHEGVHWFLSGTERPNPVWLEEGIAEVFSTFQVRKSDMEWGRPIDSHVVLLNYTRPLPLAELLSTARGDLFGDDSVRTSLVYAESWAFIHFLLFGKHSLPRDALPHFLDAMQAGALQEEAFRTAFGRTYADLDGLLADYLRGGAFFVRRMPLVPAPPATVQTATVGEVEDALGRLALAARRWEQAAAHGRAVVAAMPTDPRGHEVLGLVAKEQQQTDVAMSEFLAAIEAGTHDFLPFFEVGTMMQNEAFGATGLGTMEPGKARKAANYYERAINLRPRFALSYQNLAGVIGVAEPWSPEDRKFFELGAKLFPSDPMIRIGLAILTYRAGDVATARAQLTEILGNNELTTPTRNFARRLEDAWETHAVLTEVQQLTEAKKVNEALALVDRQLAGEIGRPLRVQLTAIQKELQTAAQAKALDDALQARRYVEARRIANEILESNAAPGLKAQVRRTLGELDRRKLGQSGSDN